MLLEKSSFPRDKICGDGISKHSAFLIHELGVLDRVLAKKPWMINDVIVSAPNGALMRAAVPHLQGFPVHGFVFPRTVNK